MFPQRFLLFKADNHSIRDSAQKKITLERRDHKGSLSWIKQSDSKPGRWFIVAPLTAGHSLCSRHLEVVGERKNGRARGRHAGGVSFSRARFFFFAHYFQAPATQAKQERNVTMFPERSSIGDSAQERITLEEDQKGSLSSSWIKTATIDLDDGQFRHLQRQTNIAMFRCFQIVCSSFKADNSSIRDRVQEKQNTKIKK